MFSKTIAVPSMHPGGLDAMRSGHFGHCDVFTLIQVENGQIRDVSILENPRTDREDARLLSICSIRARQMP